ncbi:MAG: DUF547 domain-containing protein [Flavobacteriales bacterium]|nr:DUF547 domain-containing protein [Flavobacteriales bacterium]
MTVFYSLSIMCWLLLTTASQLLNATRPPSHELFDQLLKKYVTADGLVSYKGFIADSLILNQYLDTLAAHPPDTSWQDMEEIAYWINTYNASTIRLVIRNYPILSVRDMGGQLKKIKTPRDFKFIRIGNEIFSLNQIENQKLLNTFDEPRVLFAINMAARGCPNLRNHIYSASKLDRQLEDQVRTFLHDSTKNKVTEHHAELSKIFQWHRGDITKNSSFEGFIARYAPDIITFDTVVEYLDFDWSLNE